MIDQSISRVLEHFTYTGEVVEIKPIGNGHINGTYRVTCLSDQKKYKYSLQRINNSVFKDIDSLMNNIFLVTSFIRDKLIILNKDAERGTLQVIKTKDGANYYIDDNGSYWRSYTYVDDVVALDKCRDKNDFYKSGVAFGDFQYMLSDFPAEKLKETIPNFHNTPMRLENLKKSFAADVCNRADQVEKEYRFAVDRAEDCRVNIDLQDAGKLPIRVTHNDTKLNNILLDKDTGEAVCIIDLDTVMPGLSVNDFGDSIRFGASTGAEDEKDLSKISLDLDLYKAYVEGYIEGCKGCLTPEEIKALPMGAKLMTLECGIRFLTDYLDGDIYFGISYPEHNLDRARTQFKLVEDMESKWDQMVDIAESIGGVQ